MTEASPTVTSISGQDYWDHPASVGKPTPISDLRIMDDSGHQVATGESGEIWVYGANVVRGYWNKPADTARAFTDGWHRSGDVGRLDDEGRLYIVDRIKDVIIRAGENVFCGEVEAALYTHPAVFTATVLGLPHPELSEEVTAVIRLIEGETATAAQLQAHVASRLAAFKIPSTIVFIDHDVPRTATGKVLKRDVRAQIVAQLGR
jgi:long-chain acyl-CoA synthetase